MASITAKKREGESASTLLYRFSKRVKQSGVVKEFRKRRFRRRPTSKRRMRVSALHRTKKKAERERLRKLGVL